jgi:predicted Fe-S protein YdhL (DUF1289 family)
MSEQTKLADAMKTLRNPSPCVHLVSHGFTKRCRLCERRSHAKWHELASEELNPVALIEWIESVRVQSPDQINDAVALKSRIIGYICGVTGIDHETMKRALLKERQAEAMRETEQP